MPLEQAQLTWQNRLVHLGDLIVEDYWHDAVSGRTTSVASISRSDVPDDPDMICMLATLAHPRVRVHTGHDFSSLHQIYLKTGLFAPHMHRNLDPCWTKRPMSGGACTALRRMSRGPSCTGPKVPRTPRLRLCERGNTLGWPSISSTRRVSPPEQLVNSRSRILTTSFRGLDRRYLLFFVKTDNTVMNAYLRRFFAGTGTPDAVTRSLYKSVVATRGRDTRFVVLEGHRDSADRGAG